MKSKKIVIMVFLLLIFANAPANAVTLFYEDFETDLSQWTDNLLHSPTNHSGAITTDPFDPGNQALHFTQKKSRGDIITSQSFSSSTESFILTFDYLGTTFGNSGGYFGYSKDNPTDTGQFWLNSLIDGNLKGTGTWERNIQVSFNRTFPIFLMLEDIAGIAGDAYFDNILLTNGNGPSPIDPNIPAPVPEPTTLALLGTGLIGMVLYGRKKKMLKN